MATSSSASTNQRVSGTKRTKRNDEHNTTSQLIDAFNNVDTFPKTVHISELKTNLPYKLHGLRRVKTKFGTSLCANLSKIIQQTEQGEIDDENADDVDDGEIFSTFLPARYGNMFKEEQLSEIDYTGLNLICEGKRGKSYIIKLVKSSSPATT
jgi:hypothetical protein